MGERFPDRGTVSTARSSEIYTNRSPDGSSFAPSGERPPRIAQARSGRRRCSDGSRNLTATSVPVIPAERAGLGPASESRNPVTKTLRAFPPVMDYWVPARASPVEPGSLGLDDSPYAIALPAMITVCESPGVGPPPDSICPRARRGQMLSTSPFQGEV
jgi:hypothetical protein